MTTNHADTKTHQQQEFLSRLPAKDVAPLWTVMNAMVPPRPAPKAVPAVWKYNTLRPELLEAGRLVSADEAERRVLMLINPKMNAPYTTDTLYAGLQLIYPGETAPAHRHVAFALRYIVEGSGGFTAVDGQKISMSKGDMILTPSWTWHDHGHEGKGPMIWLDGLDLPLFQAFPTNFAEPYEEKRYPSIPAETSSLRWSWEDVKKVLDESKSSYSKYTYRSPKGEEVSKTIGAHAERISHDASSPSSRETCSFVFHCAQGRGHTEVVSSDGARRVLEWEDGDTFAVPSWSTITHTSASENSYLFAFSDKPLLQSLGMYRKG